MTIEILQADIENGLRDNCRSCPVAKALTRATGQPWEVHGDCFILRNCYGIAISRVEAPAAVVEFIRAFDRCQTVKPFSFEFTPPELAI